MRISRLRLTGFKSFTEPTELVVEPGLTGVVGPNGCGKSNLLEALRWVMGETSHKSMRAASMNDVIFSGTDNRPSRNWAEVTMFLDNARRQAPAEYNDSDVIEITRRIERDAGSAYRINGRESRAKDIKILFEDAATGARSPALVRQGQIGDIVNAKPESRRRILEDAAGVAGLHSRRHDAELRLNAAERNLTRLEDVVGGMSGQIESLKRQARQARRYKNASEQIRATQALVLHLVWQDAQELKRREELELQEVLSALGVAVGQEARALSEENEQAERLSPLREEEANRSAVFGRLKVETENFERESERASKRFCELEERSQQLERDIAREDNFSRESAEIITRLEGEVARNGALIETAQGATASARAEAQQADDALSEGEELLGELTKREAVSSARRLSQEATLAETTKTISRLESQLLKLESEAGQISAAAPDGVTIKAAVEAGEKLNREITEVESEALGAEEQVRALEPVLKTKSDLATQARLAFNGLTTERETLAKLLAPAQGEEYPAILDSVSVTGGYEKALGAALGDDLEAPTNDEAAVHWRYVGAGETDGELPAGVMKLSQVVRCPPELARRLDQVGVVDAAQGKRLQSQLGVGQRLVSFEGDLWRWDGFVAACDGLTGAARRLGQRNRMSALAQEQAGAEEALEACVRDEQACLGELSAARKREAQLRLAWREMLSDLGKLRDGITAYERASGRSERELAALNASKLRFEQDLDEARQKADAVSKVLDGAGEGEGLKLQAALTDAKTRTQELRAGASKKQAVLAGFELAHHMRAERLEAQRGELEGWRQRAVSALEQASTLKSRQVETRGELDTLADLPAQMETRRQTLLSNLERADKERRDASDEVATAASALKELSKNARDCQGAVSEVREQRARVEARLEASVERLNDEARRIVETVGVEPEDCLALAELPAGAQLPERADVEQRLARLKGDRERLGGVNLQADDELNELTKRRDEIEAEREDVEQAIAKLRAGIGSLNREARKRLKDAFQSVDAHFQRLFSVLFDGGEARLEMIESQEDPLEGGLEIVARPPGKKPATLSLLSGGEQSLTALALIFAVFLTNPSPICVLDEVDAPLDDANVDRFCNLMERMAAETETRFLVITHHPMTMTRMNRLFGVTMAEKGISQLVSVDLETAQGFREAS